MNALSLKSKWLLYSISGLLAMGFGLSLFGEAVYMKHSINATLPWVLYGTLSLVVFNSGVCLFGQAIIFKITMQK